MLEKNRLTKKSRFAQIGAEFPGSWQSAPLDSSMLRYPFISCISLSPFSTDSKLCYQIKSQFKKRFILLIHPSLSTSLVNQIPLKKMATEDTVHLSEPHSPHQASLDAFTSVLDTVKQELVKLRHDHDSKATPPRHLLPNMKI
jgi:hypothetical protein